MPPKKKGKGKGSDPPKAPEPSTIELADTGPSQPDAPPAAAVVDVQSPVQPYESGGWGNDQTAAGGGDDGWGPGAAEADTMWGAETRNSPTMDDGNWNGNGEGNQGWSNNPDDFGAGTSSGGGVKDGWGIQPEPAQAGGNAKKSSSKKGNSHTFQPAAPADAWGNSHPSPNAGAWGRQAQSSRAPPAPPPAPAAPAAAPAPAWSNWAREAKMLPKVTIPAIETAPIYPSLAPKGVAFPGDRPALSQQQRTQLLSSLLDGRQQAEGFPLQSQGAQSVDPRWQQAALQQQLQQVQQAQQQAAARQAQAAHAQRRQAQPANAQQQQAQAREQLARENAALYHSLQQRQAQALLQQQQAYLMAKQNENVQHKHHAQSHSRRHEPAQQADSWDDWGGNNYGSGWNNQRASTIQEEDENEYYNEDDDEDEDEKYDDNDDYGENDGYDERDDGWGQNYNQKVRFSPAVSQSTIHATAAPQATPRTHHTHLRTTHTYGHTQPRPAATQSQSQHPLATWDAPVSSKTMSIATGKLSTTVFELAPPRNGMGENTFVDSGGAALIQAQRALFNRGRRAKERVRWGFSPEKDPRVASLLRWVLAMSNGLTTIGLQKFLQTRQHGALIANADFRADSPLGVPAQPAFDWITLDDLQSTLDRVFQESVAFYDPAFQVIVFVFLLSPTGNSMAVWRRRLPVPESLRNAYQREILLIKRDLPDDYPVYVDELPVKDEAEAAPPKKKRGFWRRLFRFFF